MRKLLRRSGVYSGNCNIVREFDHHICLGIRVDPVAWPSSPRLYWFLVDPDTNHIELGIDRISHRLLSVTVIIYKGGIKSVSDHPICNYTIPESIGVPEFFVDLWDDSASTYGMDRNYYDYPGKCQVEVGVSSIRLVLHPDKVASRTVGAGWLVCEFNNNDELCSIIVRDLSEDKIAELRNCLFQHDNAANLTA